MTKQHLDCAAAAADAGLTPPRLEELSQIARATANLGGSVLMQHYGQLVSIQQKARAGDLVTNADLAAEKAVLSGLGEATPEISVLAEESGAKGDVSELCWCVDPLDGTTNFAHGYPFFATSVGLLWRGLPILGAVAVPFLQEVFWCCPGTGAFLDDQRIQVSGCSSLEDSLLVTGFAYDRRERSDNNYAEFCRLTHKTRGVRRGGAAAVDLAYVAAGRLDGYWERGLSPWDITAGAALVVIAGGEVSDYRAKNYDVSSGRILATGPGLHTDLQKELEDIEPLAEGLYAN
ncbi:inositol monophosphatase family protein [Synechococcus sp. UW179A]|uniref:inositol monophosphatase family protein n=1 Tax=Synechococcus sp. UW179A TaxID=2575510 RepID=UPI000E0EDDE8|nr:inositol monophosphatase family protein [Synechococcus sp. UW179A]